MSSRWSLWSSTHRATASRPAWSRDGEVPLDAEVAEHRDARAEVERDPATGGVHGRAREVGAHHLGRHDEARVALDLQALDRVEGVARPDAVGVLEDPEVDAGAARRARLDLELGVAELERGEQPVERRDVLVHAGPPRVGGAGLEQVAVVVPLEVGDVVVGEQRVEPLEQVLPGAVVREVEHVLLPRGNGQLVASAEDPVGMPPGELAVEVDHLGLDPEAELHAESAHLLDERPEARGPHALVDEPVAETGGVVTPAPEPAVVEHESLDADRGRALGEGGEGVEVVVEVHGLPGVERHRPRASRMPRARPQLVVEAPRQLVEPVAPRADRPRGRVRLALGEHDLAGSRGARSRRGTTRRWACARRRAGGCRSRRGAPRRRGRARTRSPGGRRRSRGSRRSPAGRAGSRARGRRS